MICPSYRTFTPNAAAQRTYENLYPLFNKLYFTLGKPDRDTIGDVLPKLIVLAESAKDGQKSHAARNL
jgi:hypothetical protein